MGVLFRVARASFSESGESFVTKSENNSYGYGNDQKSRNYLA